MKPLTGDSGALPQGEVPAPAGQDQVPGPAGADHDTVSQHHSVGIRAPVGGRVGWSWASGSTRDGMWQRAKENDLCLPFLFNYAMCVCVCVLRLRCCVGFSLAVAG